MDKIQTALPNGYLVSTIERDEGMQALDSMIGRVTALVGDTGRADIGSDGRYETMVFPCDEEGKPLDFGELDFARYESEDDARSGHEELRKKWLEMPAGISRE